MIKISPKGVNKLGNYVKLSSNTLPYYFSNQEGAKTLSLENNKELFAYIMGIIRNRNCFLYRINGMEDHIHILSDLHSSIALADYVRDIKTSTSIWLKKNNKFPNYSGWAEGYAALTYSYKEKDIIIDYIKNQQIHHKKVSFEDELRKLLKEEGVKINEQYFP